MALFDLAIRLHRLSASCWQVISCFSKRTRAQTQNGIEQLFLLFRWSSQITFVETWLRTETQIFLKKWENNFSSFIFHFFCGLNHFGTPDVGFVVDDDVDAVGGLSAVEWEVEGPGPSILGFFPELVSELRGPGAILTTPVERKTFKHWQGAELQP